MGKLNFNKVGELIVARRQGDVILAEIKEIPKGAKKLDHLVLAEGEVTGHKHQVLEKETAELYEKNGKLFLRVIGDECKVNHEEHKTINPVKKDYFVDFPQEYDYVAEENKKVVD